MIAAILDHLWQSTLVAGVLALLTLSLRRNSARLRYALWFAASAKFLLPLALVGLAGEYLRSRFAMKPIPAFEPVQQAAWPFTFEIVDPIIPAVSEVPAAIDVMPSAVIDAPSTASIDLASVVLALWAIGTLAMIARWLRHSLRLRAVVRAAASMRLAADIPIPVKSSVSLMEPSLIGIWRPVLLFPEGIADRLAPAELNAIIAHELCHLRRRDNLTASIHMLVLTLFWFHPLLWWIGTRLIAEREQACDESVVAAGNDPEVYAESILKVCRLYLRSPLACASGVSGADLMRRVETIMANQLARRLGAAKIAALSTSLAALALALAVVGYATNRAPATAVAAEAPTEAEPAMRPALDGLLKAAFDLVSTKAERQKFDEALAKIAEARALPDLTSYEIALIYDHHRLILLQRVFPPSRGGLSEDDVTRDFEKMAELNEAALNIYPWPKAELLQRLHGTAISYYQVGFNTGISLPKVMALTDRYIAEGGDSDREPPPHPNVRTLREMTQTRMAILAALGAARAFMSQGRFDDALAKIQEARAPGKLLSERNEADEIEKRARANGGVLRKSEAPSEPTLRPVVDEALKAASDLLTGDKDGEAFAKIEEARAVPNLTPYEASRVYQTHSVLLRARIILRNTYRRPPLPAEEHAREMAKIAELEEAALSIYPGPKANMLRSIHGVAISYYQSGNYPKVIALTDRYIAEGGNPENNGGGNGPNPSVKVLREWVEALVKADTALNAARASMSQGRFDDALAGALEAQAAAGSVLWPNANESDAIAKRARASGGVLRKSEAPSEPTLRPALDELLKTAAAGILPPNEDWPPLEGKIELRTFDEALAKIGKAQPLPGLTQYESALSRYETAQIYDLQARLLVGRLDRSSSDLGMSSDEWRRELQKAAELFETALNMYAGPKARMLDRLHAAAIIYCETQSCPKAIPLIDRYLAEGGDPDSKHQIHKLTIRDLREHATHDAAQAASNAAEPTLRPALVERMRAVRIYDPSSLPPFDEMRAMSGLTPYEIYRINDFNALVIKSRINRLPEDAHATEFAREAQLREANLASGLLPKIMEPEYIKSLAKTYYQAKNYVKAFALADRYLAEVDNDPDFRMWRERAATLSKKYAALPQGDLGPVLDQLVEASRVLSEERRFQEALAKIEEAQVVSSYMQPDTPRILSLRQRERFLTDEALMSRASEAGYGQVPGIWIGHSTGPVFGETLEGPHPVVLELKADGTGTITAGLHAPLILTDSKVEGPTVSFVTGVNRGNGFVGRWSGVVRGDELHPKSHGLPGMPQVLRRVR